MLTLFQIHFPRNISYMLSGIHEREKKKKGIITLQTAFLLFLIFKMVLWDCVLHGLMLKGVQIPRSYSKFCDAMYMIYILISTNGLGKMREGGREGCGMKKRERVVKGRKGSRGGVDGGVDGWMRTKLLTETLNYAVNIVSNYDV